MTINSPLANLAEVLEQVKKSAGTYKQKLQNNEAATRAVLIDPVLRALGWDITDPSMVEVELTRPGSCADYALKNNSDCIKLIIEAKKLGSDLTSFSITQQAIQYAIAFQVNEAFLTDGIVWKHLHQIAAVGTQVDTIDLEIMPLHECGVKLISLIDAYQFSQAVPTYATANPIPAPLPVPGFIPLDQLTQITGQHPPKSLRLPDNSIVPITYWKDILHQCAVFVMKNQPNLHLPFHDYATQGTINLIYNQPDPQRPNAIPIQYQGHTVFLNKNYSSENCVKNSIHILKELPPHFSWQAAVKF